jgi:hypothetical protein
VGSGNGLSVGGMGVSVAGGKVAAVSLAFGIDVGFIVGWDSPPSAVIAGSVSWTAFPQPAAANPQLNTMNATSIRMFTLQLLRSIY